MKKMTIPQLGRKRFTPSLKWTLLTMIGCAVLMSLGFWQIHRGEEKHNLLQLAQKQTQMSFLEWHSGMVLPLMYQPVRIQGRYLAQSFLLDNQPMKHEWGYNVLTPFEIAPNQIVLVDRGWVAGDAQRVVLPVIKTPDVHLSIQGQAYFPSLKGVLLGGLIDRSTADLVVIERIDIKGISNLLHKSVYPFIIRLDKQAPSGYVRHWPVVAMSPQRHYAYAFQWFAMAVVLLIIYIALSRSATKTNV